MLVIHRNGFTNDEHIAGWQEITHPASLSVIKTMRPHGPIVNNTLFCRDMAMFTENTPLYSEKQLFSLWFRKNLSHNLLSMRLYGNSNRTAAWHTKAYQEHEALQEQFQEDK